MPFVLTSSYFAVCAEYTYLTVSVQLVAACLTVYYTYKLATELLFVGFFELDRYLVDEAFAWESVFHHGYCQRYLGLLEQYSQPGEVIPPSMCIRALVQYDPPNIVVVTGPGSARNLMRMG